MGLNFTYFSWGERVDKAKLKGLLCQWVSDVLHRIDNGLFTFEKYPHMKDTKYPHLKDTKCPHMKDTKCSHMKNTKCTLMDTSWLTILIDESGE